MTSNDKKIIYNLLKTASSNIQGYKSQDFTFDISKFKDDIKIIKSENNTTNINFSKNEVIQEIKNASIDSINNKITKCNRCRLCETRKNVVPGIGCKSPLVLVIGEGPGYEEDLKGEPFVGPAGQLLDKMLAAIQLSRNSNTYIANIECGKTWISDRTLEKISIALNTDVYMFFVPEPEETCKEDKYVMLENTYHRLNKSYDEFMNYCENVFFKEIREILGGSVVPDINGKN